MEYGEYQKLYRPFFSLIFIRTPFIDLCFSNYGHINDHI